MTLFAGWDRTLFPNYQGFTCHVRLVCYRQRNSRLHGSCSCQYTIRQVCTAGSQVGLKPKFWLLSQAWIFTDSQWPMCVIRIYIVEAAMWFCLKMLGCFHWTCIDSLSTRQESIFQPFQLTSWIKIWWHQNGQWLGNWRMGIGGCEYVDSWLHSNHVLVGPRSMQYAVTKNRTGARRQTVPLVWLGI